MALLTHDCRGRSLRWSWASASVAAAAAAAEAETVDTHRQPNHHLHRGRKGPDACWPPLPPTGTPLLEPLRSSCPASPLPWSVWRPGRPFEPPSTLSAVWKRKFMLLLGRCTYTLSLAHLAGAELDRCGGGECREMDDTESFEPGRWPSPLLVLACTMCITGATAIGGDLVLIGHTTAANAVGVVASRLLLLEKVIFLRNEKLANGSRFHLKTYFSLVALSRSNDALLQLAVSLAGAVDGGVS